MSLQAHAIATEIASDLIKKSLDAGLSWPEALVVLETTLVISVCAAATMADSKDPERFAKEFVDSITEHAHLRVLSYFRGDPG